MPDEMLIFNIVDCVAQSLDREYQINRFRLNSGHFSISDNSVSIFPAPC